MTDVGGKLQVAIIEQGVAPGGGAWLGGQLFSAMIVRLFTPALCSVSSLDAAIVFPLAILYPALLCHTCEALFSPVLRFVVLHDAATV